VKNIKTAGPEVRQFNTLINHARKHGSRVALWVTLKGTQQQAERVTREATREQVLALVLILLDKKT
jgi:hypothetical protein